MGEPDGCLEELASLVEHGLLDHLIRPSEHWRRDLQTERLRRLEVDHQFELGWLLDGKVSGLGALEDLDVISTLASCPA